MGAAHKAPGQIKPALFTERQIFGKSFGNPLIDFQTLFCELSGNGVDFADINGGGRSFSTP
jgi:hypothetical protein